MSAAELREAAALMRERAQAATAGPWLADVLGSEGYAIRETEGKPRPGSRIPRPVRVARCGYEDWDTDKGNAEHIASWHPAVALAVADWLDHDAALLEEAAKRPAGVAAIPTARRARSLAVARAYLGGAP